MMDKNIIGAAKELALEVIIEAGQIAKVRFDKFEQLESKDCCFSNTSNT
jgi:hypothetical protein